MLHISNAQILKFYTLITFLVVLSKHIPDENDPSFFEKLVELTSPVSFEFVFGIFIVIFTKF